MKTGSADARTAEALLDAGSKSTNRAFTIALPRRLAAFSKPPLQTSHAIRGRMWSFGVQPEIGIYRPHRTAILSWSGLLLNLLQDQPHQLFGRRRRAQVRVAQPL